MGLGLKFVLGVGWKMLVLLKFRLKLVLKKLVNLIGMSGGFLWFLCCNVCSILLMLIFLLIGFSGVLVVEMICFLILVRLFSLLNWVWYWLFGFGGGGVVVILGVRIWVSWNLVLKYFMFNLGSGVGLIFFLLGNGLYLIFYVFLKRWRF